MLTLPYKLEFFSFWHCGSGMGGGDDADYTPICDADGMPYVPGKTLKGLFREASEVLCDSSFTKRLFGIASEKNNSGAEQGTAIWSNAELPRATRAKVRENKTTVFLKDARYFVKIGDDGQTVDQTLRRGEYVLPMTLYGTISNVEEKDLDNLRTCMGYIKQMGLQRNRGFGRCRFTPLTAEQKNPLSQQTFTRQQEYHFKCHFLAPVVLNTTGATEHNIDSLDYVPGANFLGILAKDYDSFGAAAFDVFHSGKVQFGNGYPLCQNVRTLPCPANWHIPKGGNIKQGPIYASPEACEKVQADLQPKQIRGGYFLPGDQPGFYDSKNLIKSFALKSAYRRDGDDEDGRMFGYSSLPEDTDWMFTVKIDKSIPDGVAQKIITFLQGRHQIGRSKTAQYGSVEITLAQTNGYGKSIAATPATGDIHYFYAASNLAFVNANGLPTLVPSVEELGFPKDATLDIAHSAILFREYCPWNGKRKSRDSMRLVISAGSVLAIKSSQAPALQAIAKGVGLYRSEGFGEVLYNPAFLQCEKLIEKQQKKSVETNDTLPSDEKLLKLLKNRKDENENLIKLYSYVSKVINNRSMYSRVSPSQWGTIRAIANTQNKFVDLWKALFQEEEKSKTSRSYDDYIKNNRKSHSNDPGFLMHGKTSTKWKNCRENLQQSINEVRSNLGDEYACLFIAVLASEMGKKSKKGR